MIKRASHTMRTRVGISGPMEKSGMYPCTDTGDGVCAWSYKHHNPSTGAGDRRRGMHGDKKVIGAC